MIRNNVDVCKPVVMCILLVYEMTSFKGLKTYTVFSSQVIDVLICFIHHLDITSYIIVYVRESTNLITSGWQFHYRQMKTDNA